MKRTITEADVCWAVTCQPEGEDPEDNFKNREDLDFAREQMAKGNIWGWCYVTVSGEFGPLVAADHLGCCSYESTDEFCRSRYYRAMKADVVDQLNRQLGLLDLLLRSVGGPRIKEDDA